MGYTNPCTQTILTETFPSTYNYKWRGSNVSDNSEQVHTRAHLYIITNIINKSWKSV